MIQIRERDLDAADLARLVVEVAALARGSRTRVVVNDRLDIALASGAGGVHLRADSIAPAIARSIVPRGFLIGRSVHGVDEAIACAADVDYLIAGTVWTTESKPAAVESRSLLGRSGLAAIATAVRVPVVAIGGVTPERVQAVVGSGAAGIAAIGLFMADPEPGDAGECRAMPLRQRVEAIRMRFDTSKAAS